MYQGYAFYALSRDNVGNQETKGTNATSEAQTFITDNVPPQLAPIADQTAYANRALTLTVVAWDTNVPAQTLTFSLAPSTPAGAAINATNGLLTWTPTPAAIGTTNILTVQVTDDGLPPMNAARSFRVTVIPEIVLTALRLTNHTFSVDVNAPTGRIYTLQFSTDLRGWTNVLTTNVANLPFTLVDTNAISARKFYRLRAP